MTKTGKTLAGILVAVLIFCIAMANTSLFTKEDASQDISVNESLYEEAKNALNNYDSTDVLGEKRDNADSDDSEVQKGRFTQRVTIMSEGTILPISGTVTKSQDDFYPGTYEISFSSNMILTSKASIIVDLDITKGECVYILTGDRENGYTEFAQVVVSEDNKVRFDTDVIQNYTISTTDIESAQEAMAKMTD